MSIRSLVNEQPTVTMIISVGPDILNLYLCLESLTQQRYQNLKLIIVDNGLNQKALEKIVKILANANFPTFIWKPEQLSRIMFGRRNEEIQEELVFFASPYIVYDRQCIRNLVLRLIEDQKVKGAIPKRILGIKSKSITQKCLISMDASIKQKGDAFGGLATNGILYRRAELDDELYWNLLQHGYLETGITFLQNWSQVITVREAKCRANHPRSVNEFIRSVYLEARYDRLHLPFRTHTNFSALSMVLLMLGGVIIETISGPFKLFNGQIILTFLIPLYISILWPIFLRWEKIEQKWTLTFIPALKILSAFVYVPGKFQRLFRFDKILTSIVNTPETTILPITLILLYIRNVGYIMTTALILQTFYLGFILSLSLLKGSKLNNHVFYGIMLSTPINYFLTWVQENERLIRNIPPEAPPTSPNPLFLTITDPLTLCLLIGCLVYVSTLIKWILRKF